MNRGPQPDGPPEALVLELVRLLRQGSWRNVACRRVGIDPKTLRNWLTYAEKGDERYLPVRAAILEAEAEVELEAVRRIGAAAREDWKADAWWLEKRYPKRYGSRARLEHSGEIVTRPFASRSDAELDAIIAGAEVVTASTDEPDDDGDE